MARFTLDNPGAAGRKVFCLGMAFRRGEIPNGQQPVCDLSAFQATVLNRWPDGSAKFALLAGAADLAAGASQTFNLRPGPAAVAAPAVSETELLALEAGAELAFLPHGRVALRPLIGVESVWSASLGRFTPGRLRTLISGPQMSSWLYQASLPGHAHLSAWFEVRCWAGGVVEILPWVENGWWNVPSPQTYDGSLVFAQSGSERLRQSLTLPHHARVAAATPEATGWRRGGEVLGTRIDVLHLQSTGLVPTYFASASATALARQVSSYQPMARANQPDSMGAGGYARHIGLLPEWDAVFLTSGGAAAAQRAVLVNALAHGRWSLHFRDERTARPVSPLAYPTRVIRTSGGSSGLSAAGASSANDYTPTGTGSVVGVWADSHHLSGGFLAYLLSGWNYFLEETQFVASTCFYKLGDLTRQGTKGILRTDTATTPRGVAWSLRSLGQAAALTPVGDALQPAYVGVVEANVDYNHRIYVAQPNNPFGLMAPYGDAYTPAAVGTTQAGSSASAVRLDAGALTGVDYYVGWFLTLGGETRRVTRYDGSTRTATVETPFSVATGGVAYRLSDQMNRVPIWMEDFITGAMGYLVNLGVPMAPGVQDKLAALFQWKARSVVGRFGTPGKSDEYHYCDAAQYELAGAPTDAPDFLGGTGPFYANWGDIYRATTGTENVARASDQLRGAYFPGSTSYWGNLQPALAYAVAHAVPGAVRAYERMTGDPQWSKFLADGNAEPVWSVAPPR